MSFFLSEMNVSHTPLSWRNHSAQFENAKMAFEEGGGSDEFEVDNYALGQEHFSNDDVQGGIERLAND
jgi:hypothetical protein